MKKNICIVLIISIVVLLTTNIIQVYNSNVIKGESVKNFYQINISIKNDIINNLEYGYTVDDVRNWSNHFAYNKLHFWTNGVYSETTIQMYNEIDEIVWLLNKGNFGSEEDKKELLRLLDLIDSNKYFRLVEEFEIKKLNIKPPIEDKIEAFRWYLHYK